MRKIVLAFLLLFSMFSQAATKPNSDEYTVNIRVASSRFGVLADAPTLQYLEAVIDGKKYFLQGDKPTRFQILALGDYKGKLVKDEHPTTYLSMQVYELLLPDNKTMKFTVVGVSE